MDEDVEWHRARSLAARSAQPLPPVPLPLEEAVGRVLAEDLVSLVDLPPFDTAAMDGWAVRGNGPWHVVGELRAGDEGLSLGDGEAARISTGAVAPDGCAVLRSEHGDEVEGLVQSTAPPLPPGHDIRRRGEETTVGERVLSRGTLITPPVAGLAAACGHDHLPAVPRPTVSLLVLGDELLERGVPRGGAVRDALSPQLPSWLHAMGAHLVDHRRVSDDFDLTRDALGAATGRLVLTTGGSSRGPADHVRAAVAELGGQFRVQGVAVRPGHPMALATLPDGRVVVALPGNPLAALSALVTLAWPVLDAMSDLPLRPLRRVTVLEPIGSSPTAHRIVPGRWTPDGVSLSNRRGPAMLTGMAAADVLVVIPPAAAGAAPREALGLELPWRG